MAFTYEMIQTATLVSSQASVTFSSIPSTYTDLVLVGSAQSAASGRDSIGIAVNGSGSPIYSRTYLEANGTSVTSGRQNSQIRIVSDYIMGTSGVPDFGTYTWNFMNYSNTTTKKTVLFRGSNTQVSGGWNSSAMIYLVNTVSAINSLTIATMNGPNLAAGSTFTLYGINAA
jgi:hypothetical protein